jgi:ribosomal protein S27AE
MALKNTSFYNTHVVDTTPAGSHEVRRTKGVCPCGRTVFIDYDDIECECGRCYNLFGQELLPHDQRPPEDGRDDDTFYTQEGD